MEPMHCRWAAAERNASGCADVDACVDVGAYASLVVNKARDLRSFFGHASKRGSGYSAPDEVSPAPGWH